MKTIIKLMVATLVFGAIFLSCSDEGNLNTNGALNDGIDTWYGTVWGIVYDGNEPQNGAYVSFQEWVIEPGGEDYWWELWHTTTPGPDPDAPPGEYFYDNYRFDLEGWTVRVWAQKGGKSGATEPWIWHNGHTYHKDVYLTQDG